MYCNRCGKPLPEGAGFCPACGAGATAGGAAAAAPALPSTPPRGRVLRHLNVLAVLWLVLGLLRLFPALVLMGFGAMATSGVWMHTMGVGMMPRFALGWMTIIGWLFLSGGLLSLLVAWGLYQRQNWGRIFGIVMAVLTIVFFPLSLGPLGIALGIYTLWVLAPEASEREWEAMEAK